MMLSALLLAIIFLSLLETAAAANRFGSLLHSMETLWEVFHLMMVATGVVIPHVSCFHSILLCYNIYLDWIFGFLDAIELYIDPNSASTTSYKWTDPIGGVLLSLEKALNSFNDGIIRDAEL